MSEVLVPFAIAAGIMLAISALLAVIRMVRGPSVLDRIMASDVIITVLLLTMGVEMVVDSHTRTVPIMLAVAATAAFSTIAVARYVSRPSRRGKAPEHEEEER